MEQSSIQKQFQHNSMDPRNEELQPGSQSFIQDPLSGMHTNIRAPDLNVQEFKPVHNYSIQTGEEFALEFMRDRVNPRKPFLPYTDPNCATDYMELKGMLGIDHTGSESGSDISMLTAVEKCPKEFERKDSSLHKDRGNTSFCEDRSNYGSLPQTLSGYDSSRGVVHGYASTGASGSLSMKMKVLCSFGGKILPRPSDGKLRHVGGETRIIRIRKDISWEELVQKAVSIYNQTHVIKYQLPGEDLDALVSVSCYEDLQNMMEECSELEDREGSQKLRMFLFSMSDLDDAQFGLGSVEGDSEAQYMVAVNGMDMVSRNSTLHGLMSSSANILGVLDGQDIEGQNRLATHSIGVSTSPLTGTFVSSSTIQSSQPILPSSSDVYEPYSQTYHGQMMPHGESKQYPFHHGQDPPHHSPFEGIPTLVPLHGLMNQQRDLTEAQQYSGLCEQNLEMAVMQVKPECDGFVQQKSDTKNICSSEQDYTVPPQPHDGSLIDHLSFEEAVVVVAASEGDQSLLSSKNEAKHQEPEDVSSSVDAVNPVQLPKSSDDNPYSSSAFAPADSESSVVDLSYLEPPTPAQRYFYSERIPREQAELLNRLSKSDDSHGSQFLISHSRSDIAQQDSIAECVDKLHDGNLALQTEQSSRAKPLFIDTHTIDDGLAQLQKYKEFADAVFQMHSKHLQDVDCELRHESPEAMYNKDAVNENTVLTGHATNGTKDGSKKPLADVPAEAGSKLPAVSQVAAFEHHKDTSSDLPKLHWSEGTCKGSSSDDAKGQAQTFSWIGSPIEDVSQEIPSGGDSAPVQGDIVIDINDRFPRDFLSDIFSKAILSEDSSAISPLPKDGAGLSLYMENHEPKRWSYFQKLAQEGFVQKDDSLIDQDHLGFSTPIRKVEEGDHVSYRFTPLTTDGVSDSHLDSQLNPGENDQKELPRTVGADNKVLHSNYDDSQVKGTESMQLDGMTENLRMPDSVYEEGKIESRNIGLPPLDPSLGEIDISTLQV
ncbi:hypothetical protein FH972_019407 [Carpinus fangiana]|uniref:PB1 domain-containing protein n=1 Tax=Carpinus fangiana TaxID=176857 RepID=A0A5N6RT07_9ROSI|nr:hypothetical protein FH972_019407 [Carpinus fangiana]